MRNRSNRHTSSRQSRLQVAQREALPRQAVRHACQAHNAPQPARNKLTLMFEQVLESGCTSLAQAPRPRAMMRTRLATALVPGQRGMAHMIGNSFKHARQAAGTGARDEWAEGKCTATATTATFGTSACLPNQDALPGAACLAARLNCRTCDRLELKPSEGAAGGGQRDCRVGGGAGEGLGKACGRGAGGHGRGARHQSLQPAR